MTNTLIDTIVGKIAADLLDRVESDGFCLHKSSIEDVCRKVLSVELHKPVVTNAMLDEYGRTVVRKITVDRPGIFEIMRDGTLSWLPDITQGPPLTASEIKARYKAMNTPKTPPPMPKLPGDILDEAYKRLSDSPKPKYGESPVQTIADSLKAIDKIKADMIDKAIYPPGIGVKAKERGL